MNWEFAYCFDDRPYALEGPLYCSMRLNGLSHSQQSFTERAVLASWDINPKACQERTLAGVVELHKKAATWIVRIRKLRSRRPETHGWTNAQLGDPNLPRRAPASWPLPPSIVRTLQLGRPQVTI